MSRKEVINRKVRELADLVNSTQVESPAVKELAEARRRIACLLKVHPVWRRVEGEVMKITGLAEGEDWFTAWLPAIPGDSLESTEYSVEEEEFRESTSESENSGWKQEAQGYKAGAHMWRARALKAEKDLEATAGERDQLRDQLRLLTPR